MGSFKEFYLTENPDRVLNSVWVKTPSARTFGYVNNKLFVSKDVTNHPDFAIHLLNSKQISFSDLPKKSQEAGEVDRNSFKYAGRLWTTEKIISFWQFPSKNDFDKLIIDLNKNGISINDNWKVDIEAGSKNKLEPITNYSNKFQNIQVKQIDHLVDPMLKKKDPKAVIGNVEKHNKLVPKDWTIAKWNHIMKQESLEENVPTSVAPASISTGQHAKKLGDVSSRPNPDLITSTSKDKIKKKIKSKLKDKNSLDKYLKP